MFLLKGEVIQKVISFSFCHEGIPKHSFALLNSDSALVSNHIKANRVILWHEIFLNHFTTQKNGRWFGSLLFAETTTCAWSVANLPMRCITSSISRQTTSTIRQ